MAAVLFTDLVGSTELLSRLGETAFDKLRRDHFAALRGAVAGAGGEEVKTLGDGILAVFDSAADAVAAAVGAQQAVERQGRRAGVPIALRVGLALGDVAFEEADVFGTPVVEAARLVAAARPGQILATALVRMVAGRRTEASFIDAGSLELKGIPEPVAVCEVAWEPLAAAASVPLPSLLVGVGRIFVGRNDELERCNQLWKEAAAGERRVVLLAGEPGIGKTRLATELARGVYGEGALVLAGRCDEDLGVPYQPFVEALRHYVAHAAPSHLGRHGGELTRLVPEVGERVPGLAEPLRSDPETERYRLFDSVAAWLADASVESTVLLVLDDLQWAAKPTLLLLRHVLRSSEPLRLLIVVTYRDTDISRGHPLSEFLADLRREGGVERFSLAGLDRAAVSAYIEAAAGHALPEEDDDFPRAMWEETEGNPFFVAEVLRHLAESGAIEQRDGRWVTTAPVEELGIPEGVRDVVGRRLSRLGEGTDRILGVASVVGLEFEPAVVGAAGGFEEYELFSALEEAAAARLLTEVPNARFRFAHALVRATLYDELSGPRRVALHRRVAEAIEALHADALDDHFPALAHHWARASAPAAETARAVDYAARAGDRALAQLAHDEAVAYYRSALELLGATDGPPDEARRLELLISLGDAERRAGVEEHRQTLLDAAHLAKQRGDTNALARAALANCRGAFVSAIGVLDAERVAVLEAALDAVGPEESPRRARLLANLGIELVAAGDRPRRVALSDEALALARRLGDPRTLVDVLMTRVYTIQAPDTLTERLAITAELLSIADRLEDPVVRFLSAFLRVRCVVETGDAEEADRCVGIMERLAGELGQPALRWFAGWNRAARLLSAGRLADADRLSHEGLKLGQVDATQIFAAQQFQLLFDAGRLSEVEDTLVGIVTRIPGLVIVQLMLAAVYCELDRDDEARAIFDPLAAKGFVEVPRDYMWMRSMGFCASLSAHLRDSASAQVVYDLLLPYSDQIVVTASIFAGAVVHYLGVLATALGWLDEAETRFAAAEATHGHIGAPSWLARTRLEWARMLLVRRQPGDAERARELLAEALTTAQELGLGNVERRAIALLEDSP